MGIPKRKEKEAGKMCKIKYTKGSNSGDPLVCT
jgi:hypothetical protein